MLRAFDRLGELALSAEKSRRLIETMLKGD